MAGRARGGTAPLTTTQAQPSMRQLARCSVFILLALLAVLPAAAQQSSEYSKWEINTGLSYQRLSAPGLPANANSLGGWGGMAYHVTRHLSLAAEFAGQKKIGCSEGDVECVLEQVFGPLVQTYSSMELLGGPRISTRRGGTLDWFGHALFGVARTRVTITDRLTEQRTESRSGARFAMGFGTGMDVNVVPEQFAIRLFQIDYLPVQHAVDWRHNVRVHVGLVFRFGGRR